MQRSIEMSKKTAVSTMTAMACLGIIFAMPASAQYVAGTGQQPAMTLHHQRIAEVMKDMTQAMGSMTDQMAKGDLTPEQRKEMAQRMDRMSHLMHQMSGLESRPAMKDAESQKQMELMKKQMGEMMGDMPVAGKSK